jgi:hypothetical protein
VDTGLDFDAGGKLMAHILCKIPTRTRPQQFDATLRSFVQHQIDAAKVTYLISCDNDDDTMKEYVDANKSWLTEIGARRLRHRDATG